MHSYIEPVIGHRPQSSTVKKKSATKIMPMAGEVKKETSIRELAAIAKNDNIDIVKLLKQHMTVVEVAL